MTANLLPAGDYVLACVHVDIGGHNRWVQAIRMDHKIKDFVKEAQGAEKADWMMLCEPCSHAASADSGVPYRLFRLSREVRVGT